METDRIPSIKPQKVTAPLIFHFTAIMGFRYPTMLNSIAVLMLISGVSTAMHPISAERCQTAPGTRIQCKELCSLGSVVENIVHRINTCLNQTTTWTVSNTNPMIIIPHTKNATQGFKKRFTWRQLDFEPPAPGKTRSVCKIRCIPIRDDADTRVKRIKPIAHKQGNANSRHADDQVKNIKPISHKEEDADSIHLKSTSNSEGTGKGKPKIQEGEKETMIKHHELREEHLLAKNTTYERSAKHEHEHEHPEEEQICIPDHEFLFYNDDPEQCKPSDSSNYNKTHEDEVKECDSDAVRKASCGKVEGVCPSMTVLNCLAGMQAESEHGKSNIDGMDNTTYHDRSTKIRIESLGHGKYELTKDQLDQLKNFEWYDLKSQVLSTEKPMVVHVQDKSLNRTSKYVIVKEIGKNVLVGVPYSELPRPTTTTPPTTTTTRPPTTPKPSPPPRGHITESRRKSIAWMPKPLQLIGRPFFPQCLGPLSLVGCFRPQEISEQPYYRGHGMMEVSSPSGQNFQSTTELPTLDSKNQAYTDRPYIYNQESWSGKCTDQTRSWNKEESLPNDEGCDYEVYAANSNEGDNVRHGPHSYWNAEGNSQSTTNTPKSLALIYEKPQNHDGESCNQFQMNSNPYDAKSVQQLRMPNSDTTPYSRPMPQMGNSRHRITNRTPQEWSFEQRKAERVQPAKMPDYVTKHPQKYIAPAGGFYSNAPKIFEHDDEGGIVPNNHQPIQYHNPMNWVQKTDFLPSGRPVYHQGQTSCGQNFQPHNGAQGLAPPQHSGSYCHSYDHRAYPRPNAHYANPTFNPLVPPEGYTLPPTMKVR